MGGLGEDGDADRLGPSLVEFGPDAALSSVLVGEVSILASFSPWIRGVKCGV